MTRSEAVKAFFVKSVLPVAAALLYLGYSINTTDESQLEEAFALLKQAKDSGVY